MRAPPGRLSRGGTFRAVSRFPASGDRARPVAERAGIGPRPTAASDGDGGLARDGLFSGKSGSGIAAGLAFRPPAPTGPDYHFRASTDDGTGTASIDPSQAKECRRPQSRAPHP